MLGLHLALWGGSEHHKLRRPGFDSQIKIQLDDNGKCCIMYNEDPLHKTNPGGLVGKGKSKMVYVYEATDPKQCPVRIVEKYLNLLPNGCSCKKLYLRPKIKFNAACWYCDQPYGNNKVSTTIKELCNKAGFEGKFTNHSLRATSASRMYNKNIPEQVIKEVTGHRSDCVRLYKCTSDNIRMEASKTISGEV